MTMFILNEIKRAYKDAEKRGLVELVGSTEKSNVWSISPVDSAYRCRLWFIENFEEDMRFAATLPASVKRSAFKDGSELLGCVARALGYEYYSDKLIARDEFLALVDRVYNALLEYNFAPLWLDWDSCKNSAYVRFYTVVESIVKKETAQDASEEAQEPAELANPAQFPLLAACGQEQPPFVGFPLFAASGL